MLVHLTKVTVSKESESCSVVSNSLRLHGLYGPSNSPGQNPGLGSRSLLQGIFPIQGSNPGLTHAGRYFLLSEPPGKPKVTIKYFKGKYLTDCLKGKETKNLLSKAAQCFKKPCCLNREKN